MKRKAARTLLITAGSLLLLASIFLFAASIACIGINDGEWGRISRTGFFSVPDKLQWTDWQPNDGSVTPFRRFQPEVEKPEIAQFRRGDARGFLFNFTVYEGRAASVDNNATFPALGPNWGASYNSIWAISALALGIALLYGARFARSAAPKESLTDPIPETKPVAASE